MNTQKIKLFKRKVLVITGTILLKENTILTKFYVTEKKSSMLQSTFGSQQAFWNKR